MMTPQEYEKWYQVQQQSQSTPRSNSSRKVLAFFVGIAVCGFAVIVALKMDVLPQTRALPTPIPAISAPVVRQPASSNVQSAAPMATALPIQAQAQQPAQQVEQAPVQANVLPTAQVPVATAVPANVQVHYDGTDRRFVPTSTPEPVQPTVIPVPAYTTSTNDYGQPCVTTSGTTVCDTSKSMDKATQDWVASMVAAGHIHSATETAK
jgi:hypothetical protein